MTDELMKLADAYAEANRTFQSDVIRGVDRGDTRAALQAALEAQAKDIERLTLRLKMTSDTMNGYMLERDALQAKLDAMEKQEPVAWHSDDWKITIKADQKVFWPDAKNPLYASPVVQQPLTDEQIAGIWKSVFDAHVPGVTFDLELIRAVEAAHGIGGQQP